MTLVQIRVLQQYIVRWLFCGDPECDLVFDALSRFARQITVTHTHTHTFTIHKHTHTEESVAFVTSGILSAFVLK